MNFLSCVAVFAFCVCVEALPVSDNEDSSVYQEPYIRPSHFSQALYKATRASKDNISMMDGPIVMENANDEMYFVITSENYGDYAIHIANNTDDKHIELELTSNNPASREFDVIILEALDEDLVPVSRTTILIFNAQKQFSNMYKMVFKVKDQEYIILDFYYFKWFLALLTFTGLLILIIELHEIMKHVRNATDSGKYQELQDMSVQVIATKA